MNTQTHKHINTCPFLTHSLPHSLTYSLIHILPHSHTHLFTYSLIHILTYSNTHLFTYSLIHILPYSHTPSLPSSLPSLLPHSLIPYSLIHSLTHSLIHSPGEGPEGVQCVTGAAAITQHSTQVHRGTQRHEHTRGEALPLQHRKVRHHYCTVLYLYECK
jgi:hypothetical protein